MILKNLNILSEKSIQIVKILVKIYVIFNKFEILVLYFT